MFGGSSHPKKWQRDLRRVSRQRRDTLRESRCHFFGCEDPPNITWGFTTDVMSYEYMIDLHVLPCAGARLYLAKFVLLILSMLRMKFLRLWGQGFTISRSFSRLWPPKSIFKVIFEGATSNNFVFFEVIFEVATSFSRSQPQNNFKTCATTTYVITKMG